MTTRTEAARENPERPRLLLRDLLPPSDAARRLGISRRLLADLVRRHELGAVILRRGRDGRVTVCAFDPSELDRFIASRRQEAEP